MGYRWTFKVRNRVTDNYQQMHSDTAHASYSSALEELSENLRITVGSRWELMEAVVYKDDRLVNIR